MTDTAHSLRASVRSHRLTADSPDDDDDDGPPWTFGGIAVAAGDILRKADGTRVLFTAGELEAAAETQAGEPLTKDHPEDDTGRPKYPPDVDETVGRVPKAGWVAEVEGVGYEAQTHDEAIAEGMRSGSYDVSVHAFFDEEPYAGPEADVVATNIRFGDLSVVSKGDSPSNTAEWGPNQALASWTEAAGYQELSAAYADTTDDNPDDPEGLVKKLARMFGIVGNDGDSRGLVHVRPQTSDGERIRVDGATFDDARWMVCAHLEGDEYPDIGPGLGPSIGEGEPRNPGEMVDGSHIDLDEPLAEDADVYVALHYASEDGDKLDHITSADGGYFFDNAFVGVAPDGAVTAEAEAEAGSGQARNETGGNSGVDADAAENATPESTMGDNNNSGNGDGDGDGQTVGDLTVDELVAELEERFVTADDVEELVADATAQTSKRQKVDEIIANSDAYDEDDRDALLGAPEATIEREHDSVTASATGAQLPSSGQLAADMSFPGGDEDDDALDEYGTGVAEH